MPYDSLVALGNHHPQTVVGGVDASTTIKPVQCIKPRWPSDVPDPAVPVSDYLGPPQLPPEVRHPLQCLELRPGLVRVHPDWRGTAVGPAMDDDNDLDITAITPDMLRSMPEVTRRSLMEVLAGVRLRVAWTDDHGVRHARKPMLWMPIGGHWKVNGATALAMCMAADCDVTALREVLFDGLTYVSGELQGSRQAQIFTVEDVVYVVRNVIEEVSGHTCPLDACPQPPAPGSVRAGAMAPGAAAELLNAAAAMVEHYMQQVASNDPAAIRFAIQRLMRHLGSEMPVDAPHLGLSLGIVLAGAFRYVGDIGFVDFRRRWCIASLANLIWAACSFIPVPVASGAVAVAVVGGAILWDFSNPPRDYNDVVRRFESEFMLLALRRELPLNPVEVSEMHLWMRQAITANGLTP